MKTKFVYPDFSKIKTRSQLHLDRYIRFIDSRPDRQKIKSKTARHHKIPKSLGGADTKENMIHLTHREHFIAHLILYYAFGGSMTFALFCMGMKLKNGETRYSKLTSRQYAVLNEERIKLLSQPRTEEYKIKKQKSHKKNGTHSGNLKGYKFSADSNIKRRNTFETNGTKIGVPIGTRWTDETKRAAKIKRDQTYKDSGSHRGGVLGFRHSKESRLERKKKMIEKGTTDGIDKGSYIWITNGKDNKYIKPNDQIPNEWKRGFTATHSSKNWKLTDPAGVEYRVFGSIGKFCAEHNLSMQLLRRNLGKEIVKSCNKDIIGWKLEII